MRIVGQHFHLECIDVAGCFERLIPPTATFQQCRSDRLRGSVVEVVDDRLHSFTPLSTRVFFLESMPYNVSGGEWFADWGAVILIRGGIVAGARIERAGFVIVVGQFHEGVMHPHGHSVVGRGNGAKPSTGARAFKGKHRFKFAVFREIKCTRHVDSRTRCINRVRALPRGTKPFGNTMRILHQKRRKIHQNSPIFLGSHLKPE